MTQRDFDGVATPTRRPHPLPAALPVLLLPVRIEVRFNADTSPPELWVRIFPDQIAIDSHDERVTNAEVRHTHRYWETVWRAGTADASAASAAWSSLANRFGPTRGAYLVHSSLLTPTNLASRPATATPEGTPLTPSPAFPALTPTDRKPASPAAAPCCLARPLDGHAASAGRRRETGCVEPGRSGSHGRARSVRRTRCDTRRAGNRRRHAMDGRFRRCRRGRDGPSDRDRRRRPARRVRPDLGPRPRRVGAGQGARDLPRPRRRASLHRRVRIRPAGSAYEQHCRRTGRVHAQ